MILIRSMVRRIWKINEASMKLWWVWFVLILAAGVAAFAPLPIGIYTPQERIFRVQASQYAYSPGELYANPGDQVTIELVSADVVHGLYVDGYEVSVTADPGQTRSLTFTADRQGSFRLRCNVTCGAMHPFMIGKLYIGSDTILWRGIALAGIALAGVLLAASSNGRRPAQ